jgi:hypothetical protein
VRLPRVPPARIVPRAGGRLLRLAYVAVIAVATLRGLDADGSAAAVRFRLWRALHPVVHAGDVVDGARNVALFAGFGAVWLATAAPGRLRRALVRATVAGALVSATVEAAQLLSPVRWASVLDVATNTAGAFAGAFVIALAVAAARASRPVALVPAPLALVALPYVAACVFEAFSPLGRPDQIPGAWGGPANRWAVAVAHLRLHRPPWWPGPTCSSSLRPVRSACCSGWSAAAGGGRGRPPPPSASAWCGAASKRCAVQPVVTWRPMRCCCARQPRSSGPRSPPRRSATTRPA